MPQNPLIVKNFGLVLGIDMISIDGTLSLWGHIGPTYQIMTDEVNYFASIHPDQRNFQDISEAFHFSNTASAFEKSISIRAPEASQELYERIQSGKLTTIPVSCQGHMMGLSYVPDGPGLTSGFLIYTNRGTGAKGDCCTKIFRIDNSEKITPQFIHNMLQGLHSDTVYEAILSQIIAVTENKPPMYRLAHSPQKRENCSIANPRSNIQGILLCQKAILVGGFDQLSSADLESVKKEYKQFTFMMRLKKVNELAIKLKKNPFDSDLRVLASNYLEQHPGADPHLRAPLEVALMEVSKQLAPIINAHRTFEDSSIPAQSLSINILDDSKKIENLSIKKEGYKSIIISLFKNPFTSPHQPEDIDGSLPQRRNL